MISGSPFQPVDSAVVLLYTMLPKDLERQRGNYLHFVVIAVSKDNALVILI